MPTHVLEIRKVVLDILLGTGRKVTRYSCVTHVLCLWLIHFLVMELIFFPEMTARSIEYHDAVITWKHSPRYWPFVRGIHQSPVNSPHKSQLRGALMSSLICAWINVWVNNRKADDLRRHRAHYDVTVMATEHVKATTRALRDKYKSSQLTQRSDTRK